MTGLLSDRCEPNELNDVVLELNPVHRPTSEFRFRKNPLLESKVERFPAPTPDPVVVFELYVLYQSGTLRRCSDACTRNWCSLRFVLVSCDFCNSFSGGCKEKKNNF